MPGTDPELKIDGKPYRLRLTLGALATIEDVLGGGDFSALKKRLESPRVSDLVLILHALIAGGGKDLTLEVLKSSDIDFSEASRAIATAFKSLAAAEASQQGEMPGKAEAPGRCPGGSGSDLP